jgi:hypothetical protein
LQGVAYKPADKEGLAPAHKPKIIFGKKVDSLSHYAKELATLDEKIATKQEKILASDADSSCFVTFGSSFQAIKALHETMPLIGISGARITSKSVIGDGGKEVFWPNVGIVRACMFYFANSLKLFGAVESWQLRLLAFF